MFVQVSNAVRSSPSLPQLVSHRSPWWGHTLWDQRSHSDGWIFSPCSVGKSSTHSGKHFPASYVSLPECIWKYSPMLFEDEINSLPKICCSCTRKKIPVMFPLQKSSPFFPGGFGFIICHGTQTWPTQEKWGILGGSSHFSKQLIPSRELTYPPKMAFWR